MELFATYNDIDIHSSKWDGDKAIKFCEARKRIRGKYDICPFCHKELKDGPLLLLFNNWELFPNTIIHFACCNGFSTKEDAMKHLHEDYQKALAHKHWFNID